LFDWLSDDKRFKSNATINLSRNFRNSREIILFTQSVFPDFLIPQSTIDSSKTTGLKPILKTKIGWDIDNQCQEIQQIINDFQSATHNIGILVPFQNMVDNYFNTLKDKLNDNIVLTKFKTDDDIFTEMSGIHITPFKSAKGTEFDTVIIPEFDRYEWNIENRPRIAGQNDYYVAFTRAKSNLFLICRDGNPNIGDISTVNIENE
jgi:DNA helicase IV